MSAISSRPRVQKITGPVLTTVAAAGAVLAARAIGALLQSLSEPGRRAFQEATQKLRTAGEGIEPTTRLAQELARHRQEALKQIAKRSLPPVEALRVATLASLAATPFRLKSAGAIESAWQGLAQAGSLAEARQAERALQQTLVADHQRVFLDAVQLACQRAAARVGFDRLEALSGLRGEVRLVATDAAGRTLVSEIRPGVDGEVGLETEVVGVSDGSCHAILDAFEAALESEGVRSAPPKRKFTGGVCELAAAREFVRRKVKRSAPQAQPAATSSREANRRALRLNRPAAATVKARR